MDEADPVWYFADVTFLLIFVFELLYRYMWKGSHLWNDGFAIFDAAVVFLGCLDTFVLQLLYPDSAGVLRMFTVLRTLRILKLKRLLGSLPFVRELARIIDAGWFALKVVMFFFLSLLLSVYFFGVMATTIIGNQCEKQNKCQHDISPFPEYRTLSGWNYKD